MAQHIRISQVTENGETLEYKLYIVGAPGMTLLRFDNSQLKFAFDKVIELNLPFCSTPAVIYEWIKGGYPRELLLVSDIITGFVDNIYKAKDNLDVTRISIHKNFIYLSHCQEGKGIYHIPFHVMYYAFTGKHLKDQTFADKSFDTDYEAGRFIIQALDADGPYTDAEQAAVSCYGDYRYLLNSMTKQERYKKLLSLSDKGVYVLCTGGSWVYAPNKTKEEAEQIYASLADANSGSESETSFFS